MYILLDMDEVLVDFVGGALKAHDWTQKRFERVHRLGEWSAASAMGMTEEEFWRPINAEGEKFWLQLHPLPWIHEVLRLVDAAVDEWYIVTSPSQSLAAYSGKALWLRRFFGSKFDRFVITSHKHLLARSEVILIDDREETIYKFLKAGGEGIIFPSRYNLLHCWARSPAKHLERCLEARGLKERSNALHV